MPAFAGTTDSRSRAQLESIFRSMAIKPE